MTTQKQATRLLVAASVVLAATMTASVGQYFRSNRIEREYHESHERFVAERARLLAEIEESNRANREAWDQFLAECDEENISVAID